MARKKKLILEEKEEDLFISMHDYFNQAVNEDMFELGIDYTGLYMFTRNTCVEEILPYANDLIDNLCLQPSDVLIIVVDKLCGRLEQNSMECAYDLDALRQRTHFVHPDDLEDFVRRITGKRPNIFSDKVIQSIVDCFYEVEEHTTPLEAQLAIYGLPEKVIEGLIKYQPMSTQEVRELGVPHDVADAVFDILMRSYTKGEENPNLESGVSMFLFNEVSKKCTLSLILTLASAPLLVFDFWPYSLFLSLLSLSMASSARKVYKNNLSVVCIILALVLAAFSAIGLVQLAGTVILDYLRDIGYISV